MMMLLLDESVDVVDDDDDDDVVVVGLIVVVVLTVQLALLVLQHDFSRLAPTEMLYIHDGEGRKLRAYRTTDEWIDR